MRHEPPSIRSRRETALWPRRAVVGLWVVAYVLVGFTLAARWDLLMARLARPPVPEAAATAVGVTR
jgi:type VI protein secretion system component VasF